MDDESAARFTRLEGAMGERVRKSLVTVDGEVQMSRSADGRCLLLNEKNLCDLYTLHGEGALCQNCRQHPRFVADYGARREVMPGLSCPAWIEAYLKDEEKVTFCTEETDEPIGYTDIDGALFFRLYRARAAALELLQDRGLSDAVIRRFGIGAATPSARIGRTLMKEGFTEEELIQAKIIK